MNSKHPIWMLYIRAHLLLLLCDITLMVLGGVVIPLRMLNVGVFSHLCNMENALAVSMGG